MSRLQRSRLSRRAAAPQTRLDAANIAYGREHAVDHQDNGGETGGAGGRPHLADDPDYALPNFIENYSKALPHYGLDDGDRVGQVRAEAYLALLKATMTEDLKDFENIPLGISSARPPCTTILKAWFRDGEFPVPAVWVRPDGDRSTLPWLPADRGRALTVHGELNKLAANIAIGRNMAGVHSLTDYAASRSLGEQIGAQKQAQRFAPAMIASRVSIYSS